MHDSNTLEYDICIVGSGAGAGPIAYEMAKSGYKVVVLEKGPWFKESDFRKDEQLSRHSIFKSKEKDEYHRLSEPNEEQWSTYSTGQFWGGNIVGGASNFMSAYFHRLKPMDFHLLSEFGPIKGANTVDWPISYQDLEPYYAKVESVVGVSGKVISHPYLEPRSTKDYPYPPTLEHPIAQHFDNTCSSMGLNALPMARGILSQKKDKRQACSYSGYCGSYGCATGAKGSSRAALLDLAIATGHCHIIDKAMVYKVNTQLTGNHKGQAESVSYFDSQGIQKTIRTKIVVLACYAIETARLLLLSRSSVHPKGIGNRYEQVGKNLHCCAGGTGHGVFDFTEMPKHQTEALKIQGPFFNRAIQDWYVIKDKKHFKNKVKGGTLDFVFDPPSPTSKANSLKWQDEKLIWGSDLKQRLKSHFTQQKDFKFEVFCDWLTNDDCHVNLASSHKDKWGLPVAQIKAGFHPHDLKVAQYLVNKGKDIMAAMGAHQVWGNAFSQPTSNLVAGGCRFGLDPTTSVLDKDCRVHDCTNLFVSDGSFMPNGGSVTPTFTIYANAFRVADKIKNQLS